MKYGKIKPIDISNGEGIRVSLFVSGCPHKCSGCFNQELWDYDAGEEFTPQIISHIMDLCEKDYITGLSLLGGEPLSPENLNQITTLCFLFKTYMPNKDIWCYTGYHWECVKRFPVMQYIDTLVDGRFIERLKDPRLKFRGSSNQRIIAVKPSLETGSIILRKDLMNE